MTGEHRRPPVSPYSAGAGAGVRPPPDLSPRFSWIPGLPSFGSSPELWFVDDTTEEIPLSEVALLFYLEAGEAMLLANRTGERVVFDPEIGLRELEPETKRVVELGDVVAKVRYMQPVYDPDGELIDIPEELTGVELPPCRVDPAALND